MDRKQILAEAEQCICRDRQDSYGKPEDNFRYIAEFWNIYLGDRVDTKLDAEDVAMMMCLLKIARIATGEPKADNYIDLAGYSACAGEIATRGKK
jgi:hypothetical protein